MAGEGDRPNRVPGERESILRFWRDVELMNVSQSPKLESRPGMQVGAFFEGNQLPWSPGHDGHLRSRPSRVWFHRVHMGIGDRQLVVRRILESIGAEIREDDEELTRINGDCWAFGFLVDWRGLVLRESFTPASFAIAARLLAQGKPVDSCDQALAAIQRQFLEEHPEGPERLDPAGQDEDAQRPSRAKTTLGSDPINWAHLKSYLSWCPSLMGSAIDEKPQLIIESIDMPRARPGQKQLLPEGSFMNSFYLQDLRRLIEKSASGNDLGGPLDMYLGERSSHDDRIDLGQDPTSLIEATRPSRLSRGRWPAHPAHGLAVAQQAAIGEALHGDDALISVNGPPGTGKTTLLRDIVAEVVVRRARVIAGLERPEDIFTGERQYFGENQVASFLPDLVDGFGIVVTSSNNAAVENISRELPRLTCIDADCFRGAGYLAQVASNVVRYRDGETADPSWGMLSAALGSKGKRWDFFKPAGAFTSPEDVRRGAPAGLVSTLFARKNDARRDWNRIRGDFLRLDREVESAIVKMEEMHSGGGNREHRLRKLRDKTGATMPDGDFLAADRDIQQLASLWTFPDFERRRSKLFLESLRLIEATMAANAWTMKGNFNAARDMLLGLRKDPPGDAVRRTCWDTLFLTVPVVATTLASFSNLFTGMGKGSLGWLLMDEAGQAVPQSVAGALWRSRRAVVIGDPFQVEPVQTVPSVLIEHMRKLAGVDPDFCPSVESVQTVSDRSMKLGGEVLSMSGRPVWAGLPLRAHRRCAEPMFGVSNQIAYACQMVQAAPRRPRLTSPFGASSWLDITGAVDNGHVVREEMAHLERMLGEIGEAWPRSGDRDASIFIITPFKRVQFAIEHLLRRMELDQRIACGTIHSFQGREADMVLLVLGSAPGAAGRATRDWAAERPNILNVALTRAKSRIHILGSVADWSSHSYFDILARRMADAGQILTVERDREPVIG